MVVRVRVAASGRWGTRDPRSRKSRSSVPAEGGGRVGDVSRRRQEAKSGGLDVSDAKRLRALEDENAKLKKLLAEVMLDNAILNSRKW